MQHRLLTKGLALAAGLLLAASTITPATAGPETPNRGRYAALGDSYAAGVGNTPLRGSGDSGRSSEAYPVLLAGAANKVTFLAESGATTVDVLTEQVPMVPEGARQITLTVGGNDVGFDQLADACGADPTSQDCADVVNGVPGAAAGLPGNLAALLMSLRLKAPEATIYVTGYPFLFQPELIAGTPPIPHCTTMESLSGLAYQADLGIGLLNTAISSTVAGLADSDIVYVDVTVKFAGHGLCTFSEEPFIFAPVPTQVESLHPTALGEQAYADAVEFAGFTVG